MGVSAARVSASLPGERKASDIQVLDLRLKLDNALGGLLGPRDKEIVDMLHGVRLDTSTIPRLLEGHTSVSSFLAWSAWRVSRSFWFRNSASLAISTIFLGDISSASCRFECEVVRGGSGNRILTFRFGEKGLRNTSLPGDRREPWMLGIFPVIESSFWELQTEEWIAFSIRSTSLCISVTTSSLRFSSLVNRSARSLSRWTRTSLLSRARSPT
jgi:hypothetical protein